MNRCFVRRCRDEDIILAAELKRNVEDATYATYGTPDEHIESLERFCSVDYVRLLVDTSEVLLAADIAGGAPTGMVSFSRKGADLMISSLYCAVRGHGIGSSLVAAVITGESISQVVSLEVFDLNRSGRAFFESFGWRVTGQTRPSESYQGVSLLRMVADVGDIRHHLGRLMAP